MMERGMVGFLVLSGVCHFASSLQQQYYQYQYHFINKPKTWPEARQYCRQKHTDLATVNDQHDVQELAGLIKSQVSFVFIGLYRRWGWSLSEDGDYKEGELAYQNWAGGEPTQAQRYCGRMRSTGKWFATNCNKTLNFFCYDEDTTDISERFTLVENSTNWFAAQAYCRKQHTDLARVGNQLENAELQKMSNGSQAWIGLAEMSWVWSDGSEPSFTPWRPHEPLMDEDAPGCAVLDVNSGSPGITSSSCAAQLPFFCYSGPVRKHLVRLRLTAPDSSLDLEDSAVMTSILKWVERKLSDRGVTTGVKLYWTKFSKEETNTEQEEMETDEEVCAP